MKRIGFYILLGCLAALFLLAAFLLVRGQGKIFLDGYFPGVFTPNPSGFNGGAQRPCGTIYGLDNDSTLWTLRQRAQNFTRELPIKNLTNSDEQIIGIDYRPSDRSIYGVGDTGNIYRFALTSRGVSASLQPPANRSPRFDGGIQSLADFNPVVDALRLIGSNDQNFAVVNVGGNLATTAMQIALTYPVGDVNAGVDPNVAAGAYTNNFAGAPFTIFYAIDFALDTLVTIAPTSPGGSSATGGGRLQTIGRIVNQDGVALNFQPTCDIDIYTLRNGDGSISNWIIGVNGAVLFSIDLSQVNPNLQPGQTQTIIARGQRLNAGGLIDLTVVPCR